MTSGRGNVRAVPFIYMLHVIEPLHSVMALIHPRLCHFVDLRRIVCRPLRTLVACAVSCIQSSLLGVPPRNILLVDGGFSLLLLDEGSPFPGACISPHLAQEPGHVRVHHVGVFRLDDTSLSLGILQERGHGAFWSQGMLLCSTLRNIPGSFIGRLFAHKPSMAIRGEKQCNEKQFNPTAASPHLILSFLAASSQKARSLLDNALHATATCLMSSDWK